MSLEFKTEPTSSHLVAESNTTPYRTYWIQEGAWTYASVVIAAFKPEVLKPMPFLSVEDAIEWCEQEDLK